ncbi:MAG: hypothetical protein GF370_02495 [Candidatus Nealsonbacteria bacterium]|nr:hypothetical protein [Candidatus Nealsonbacteria bacterium]
MNIYSFSVKKLKDIIKENFKETEAKEGLEDLPSHLLWMLEQIEIMSDLLKASRWIGYVLARLEAMGTITNEQSRSLIRKDLSKDRA